VKIATDHVLLDEIGYEGYWVDMPKSVKEGWLYDFQTRTGGVNPDSNGETKLQTDEERRATADANRESFTGLLELITAWNLDDEDGNVMPLLSTVKNDKKKRNAVISELPIDVIIFLSDRLTKGLKVGEKTEDFSSKS